jgi:hypothetical protein
MVDAFAHTNTCPLNGTSQGLITGELCKRAVGGRVLSQIATKIAPIFLLLLKVYKKDRLRATRPTTCDLHEK